MTQARPERYGSSEDRHGKCSPDHRAGNGSRVLPPSRFERVADPKCRLGRERASQQERGHKGSSSRQSPVAAHHEAPAHAPGGNRRPSGYQHPDDDSGWNEYRSIDGHTGMDFRLTSEPQRHER